MIKSKQRITEFGEVFTSEREVNAMLDLVSDETHRLEARFLEPACGDGNFLAAVLERKLTEAQRRYGKNELDLQRAIFLSVSSLYGIDYLIDNVTECRQRLLSAVVEFSKKCLGDAHESKFLDAITFLISKNIINGDALTLTLPMSTTPIIFSEWSFTKGSMVKRMDYTLSNLLAYQPFESGSLFSDLGEEAHLPHPLKTYKEIHFLEVSSIA